jgi:hypothetical protein
MGSAVTTTLPEAVFAEAQRVLLARHLDHRLIAALRRGQQIGRERPA